MKELRLPLLSQFRCDFQTTLAWLRAFSSATIVFTGGTVHTVVGSRVLLDVPVPKDRPDCGDWGHHAQSKADCSIDRDCSLIDQALPHTLIGNSTQ
jgi:hypothetical protein